METNQINRELSNTPNFLGTFAADELYCRGSLRRPFSLVVNTDTTHQPGEHWTAIFAPSYGPAEYFDSFGFPPLIQTVQRFLDINSSKCWYYSSNSIQNPLSISCGQYCIKFIKHRSQGKSFESFISKFLIASNRNDAILEELQE